MMLFYYSKLITQSSYDQLRLHKQCIGLVTLISKKYIVPSRYCAAFCDSLYKVKLCSHVCNKRITAESFSGVYITSTFIRRYSKKSCSEDSDDFQKDSLLPSRSNIDDEGMPMSLLSDGYTKKIYLFNSLKKKKAKTQSDFSELPVAVKSQLKGTPSALLSTYPNLLQSATTTAGKDELISKTAQYPFAKSRADLGLTENDNISQSNQQERLYVPCKEIQEDLVAARELMLEDNNGTPDASLPVSDIPCGGCGALLHCKDPSLPGYMHSEKFKFCSKQRLKKELCQRCLYLQHFNVALNVSVNPEDYPKIISQVKEKKALIILIVDLTDFPCSLWPGITDIIGPTKPIFVVGNKVDLLPCDHRGYLNHIILSLKESLKNFGLDRSGNIKHVSLISAKTGYGIEELITKLHNSWCNGGDVYLVGCTNVGKSTLFNALLDSDLCKVQATDIIQRATISPWPGTTLNLLKFPILRMIGWRLYLRAQRLIKERKTMSDEQKLRKLKFSETNDAQYATLMGRVGMTFKINDEEKVVTNKKPYDSNAKEFVHGHFCYDTPGTIYRDQILNLLTVEELTLTLPKKIIIPRTYRIAKHQTMFIAGVARVDLMDSPWSILITVFSSHHLPVHMVYTEQAENFYNHYLGTEMLAVPCGSPERLQDFPSLVPKEIEIIGTGWQKSSVDVSLSSIGWISITLGNGELCKLLVYTPEGRGCYVREPPLLPFAVNLKGKRIRRTPAYENCKVSITT